MPFANQWSAERDDGFPTQPWENHTARFTAYLGPSAAVVTAHGELDASNATALADYVQRCAAHCSQLVLDLSELDFFGTSGFSALHTINVRCAGAGVQWAVVPNGAVSRLLRICDPDNTLPMTKSPEFAASAHAESRRLLELVAESG
jgi:anti-anti-sigma factor